MYTDQELVQHHLTGFVNKETEVNGVNLHYVEGGSGQPLVLIPGWPETWWAYHKVMPLLAATYRVIAVDLRGMGSSGKPLEGYDKKNMAKDIYELTRQLNCGQVHICGHDIGAHVAFSFAANYPDATAKLVMLDTPHPDASMYQLPMLPVPGLDYTYPWWLAFNQVKALPEALLAGRMRLVIDWVFKALLQDDRSISDFDKAVYSRAYDSEAGIRASNAWYQAFTRDIQDIATYNKVTAPVLCIASAAGYDMLQASLTQFATGFNMELVADSGHFLLAEKPGAVAHALLSFLN
ncbi:alpha/beta fold hydrolase [Taibaiella chishuiensis]|uniref:Pimeloyl-ACP methyl ester carboxylesterase n=1 Tax=Taibaiella chishuiensis TaxID=1434707 RepID=A0A2P8D4X7_9BACT|nr:alpha/beta hydrolase [Taibaiella chishuiensis]PSK92239.1 pimeloyl-ACP methyl ester carboxylesterase [Taibaiella chishuiensis]